MDDLSLGPSLASTRVLIAGGEPGAAERLRGQLASSGLPAADVAPDVDGAALQATVRRPDAILALGGIERALRERLDPLGLSDGPPIVSVSALTGDGTVVAYLRIALERHGLRRRVSELESVLAGQAVARSREGEQAQLDTLRRIGMAAEYSDDNTPEHAQRVGHLAAQLGRRVGMADRMVWLVRQTAPLHDIGKIAVPDSILLKPGKLTDHEFEVVKTHTTLGSRVVAGGSAELFDVAEQIVRSHHERWDGRGYPDALAGEAIPLSARLVKVADVFDVLVHERPYKDAMSPDAAADVIRTGAGTEFDPGVVQAFEDLGQRAWLASDAGMY
jgi:HD-GYP domain-containing protein (c-di-GMP phosphodiesterase class II)